MQNFILFFRAVNIFISYVYHLIVGPVLREKTTLEMTVGLPSVMIADEEMVLEYFQNIHTNLNILLVYDSDDWYKMELSMNSQMAAAIMI